MKIKAGMERIWAEVKSECVFDVSLRTIVQYVEAWANMMEGLDDGAEKSMSALGVPPADDDEETFEAASFYNACLEQIPQVQLLSVGDIGEMLVFLLQFWQFGSELEEELTFTEKRLVQENFAMKQQAAALMAAKAGVEQSKN